MIYRRQDVDRRQSIVTLFLACFTLSEDGIESLVSNDVPIGRRFFDAMDKAHAIRCYTGRLPRAHVRRRQALPGGVSLFLSADVVYGD